MSQELIDRAVGRVRTLYPQRVAAAVADQLAATWALRESSATFRESAVLLAEEILGVVNRNDRDAVRREIEAAMKEQLEGDQDRAQLVADRVFQYHVRATRPDDAVGVPPPAEEPEEPADPGTETDPGTLVNPRERER